MHGSWNYLAVPYQGCAMKSGVRWGVNEGVPAEKVLGSMIPIWGKRPFYLVNLKVQRTSTHEVIYHDGPGDGLYGVRTVESKVQKCFGINPELIVKGDDEESFRSWHDFFDELGEKFANMPSIPRGYDL